MLRILYPDLIVKFPRRNFKPKILPLKEQLQTFYKVWPDKYKPPFILLAESGLRIGELLNCDIDKENKMLIPKKSNRGNKRSWVGFYQTEFNESPKITPDALGHIFKRVARQKGINVNPHLLRAVFARELNIKGVSDRHIDTFCGRIPQSMLARNYTDYSPEVLKQIYEKVNIKILE